MHTKKIEILVNQDYSPLLFAKSIEILVKPLKFWVELDNYIQEMLEIEARLGLRKLGLGKLGKLKKLWLGKLWLGKFEKLGD